MADFNKAFAVTMSNEGGYNPGIGEHETYKGIDRGANPHWDGWPIIDVYKRDNPGASVAKLNALLSQNTQLQANILAFYKANYWNPFQGDLIKDQQLANNLFDCSVNQGEGLARKFTQLACNFVMQDTKVSTSIQLLKIDGIIGKLTLTLFNSLPAAQLNAQLNAERLSSYKSDKGYAVWGKVWEKRLKDYIS